MQLNNLAEVRDFDIEECINHLEMLHKDSKGYITISCGKKIQHNHILTKPGLMI